MSDILHDFPIRAPVAQVWSGFTSPAGLDAWWTKESAGEARLGAEYQLYFAPEFDWRARVSACVPNEHFEYTMTTSDADWEGSRIGVRLRPEGDMTQVQFYHSGWPASNQHYRTSSFCWAMYLRVLRRNIEFGELVPYDQRLDV